jgi:hypothetical protein
MANLQRLLPIYLGAVIGPMGGRDHYPPPRAGQVLEYQHPVDFFNRNHLHDSLFHLRCVLGLHRRYPHWPFVHLTIAPPDGLNLWPKKNY